MNSQNKTIEELYHEFRKPLFRYIHYKVSDTFVAEEILNDVFFKASKSLDTLKETTKVQSWLYKIATNLIIDYYRKHKNPIAEHKEHTPIEDMQEEKSILNELNCCMNDFLNQLPKNQADSLKAIYFKEKTQKEYAQHNNLNLSTVKSHVKRGKESMKIFFDKCCDFERDKLDNIIKCISKQTNKEC